MNCCVKSYINKNWLYLLLLAIWKNLPRLVSAVSWTFFMWIMRWYFWVYFLGHSSQRKTVSGLSCLRRWRYILVMLQTRPHSRHLHMRRPSKTCWNHRDFFKIIQTYNEWVSEYTRNNHSHPRVIHSRYQITEYIFKIGEGWD